MKFKKLLPIATVASTAAIVLPLVTSCAYKTYTYTTDAQGQIISSQLSNFKIGVEKLNISKATETYLNDVKKKRKILADDIALSLNRSKAPNVTAKIGIGPIDISRSTMSIKMDVKSSEMNVVEEFKNFQWIVVNGKLGNNISSWEILLAVSYWKEESEVRDALRNDNTWELIAKGNNGEETIDYHFTYKNVDNEKDWEVIYTATEQISFSLSYLSTAQPIYG